MSEKIKVVDKGRRAAGSRKLERVGMPALLLIAAGLMVWLVMQGLEPQTYNFLIGEREPIQSPVAPMERAGQIPLTQEEMEYLAALGPVTISPDPDWYPYEFIDEEGNFTGIAADMLGLLKQRLGIEFEIVPASDWDEAVELSQTGRVMILPFLNQTPAREDWLIFTEPLLEDPNVFITHEEHSFIADISSLSDETIVLPSGTSVEERVRRDFPNLTVIDVPSESNVFQAVSDRQADMTLRSLTIAAYTIRKEGLFNLKIAGQAPDDYVNRLRMGVLKDEVMLRDILNKGIATITPREREEIINRHVNITIVEPVDYGFFLRLAGGLGVLISVSFYWNLKLRRTNEALQESERSKSVLIANLPGVAYRSRFDHDWTMEFVSEGCLELTGYKSDDLLFNRVLAYNDLIDPEDREWVWQRWEQARLFNEPVQLEYRIHTADHVEKWIYEQGMFVEDSSSEVPMIEGLLIDITDRKKAEKELYRVTIHDDLTGIYNRRYILERLDKLVNERHRDGRDFSIALMDLDYFKKVNDTYGHLAGDYVLKEFADILQKSVRPYDLVGRYGGEEFLAILLNIDARKAENVVTRLQDTIRSRVFRHEGEEIRLTFSAGVFASAELGVELSVEKLIQNADELLYEAKNQGRDRVISSAGSRQQPLGFTGEDEVFNL